MMFIRVTRMVGLHFRTGLSVFDIFANCVQMGLGVLEEIPGLSSQFFSLRSGEVFWLGEDKITRIVSRTAIDQSSTLDLAQAAVNGLRMCVNEDRNRQPEQRIRVADLVDHYIETELSQDADWHSHATRIVYRQFLRKWIRPHWANVDFRDVRTVSVERWLRQLRRTAGSGWICSVVQASGNVFKLPRVTAGARSVELRASELAMILDGIDVSKCRVTNAGQEPPKIIWGR